MKPTGNKAEPASSFDADDPFPDALLASACGGEWQAIEALAERMVNHVRAVVLGMQARGDWRFADADDVTSEVCVKACNHLKRFDGRSAFRTWLRQIVMNHLRDLARKAKTRQKRLGTRMSLESPASGAFGQDGRRLEEVLAGEDGNQTIVAALDKDQRELPPEHLIRLFLDTVSNERHATIFRMRHCDGRGHHEIARLLSLPNGTVSVTLKRMEEKFAVYVKENMKEPLS